MTDPYYAYIQDIGKFTVLSLLITSKSAFRVGAVKLCLFEVDPPPITCRLDDVWTGVDHRESCPQHEQPLVSLGVPRLLQHAMGCGATSSSVPVVEGPRGSGKVEDCMTVYYVVGFL